jgi:hypothetical protein
MSSSNYTSPVNRIFQLEPPPAIVDWSIYANLGITVEHLPELARMAIDEDLLYGEADAEFLAPSHAWRMLALVGTPEAIAPLITVLHGWSEENWDWLGEEIKVVFGKIGSAALPELAKTLGNSQHSSYTRENAVMSIAEIFEHHPAAHDECIAVLTAQLSRFSKNDPDRKIRRSCHPDRAISSRIHGNLCRRNRLDSRSGAANQKPKRSLNARPRSSHGVRIAGKNDD